MTSAPPPQRLGPAAPDGSPVEFYALLPSFGEHDIVHSAIPEGAEILDDEAFGRALELSGLTLASWLDESRTWARAVRAEPGKDRSRS